MEEIKNIRISELKDFKNRTVGRSYTWMIIMLDAGPAAW